MPWRGKSKQPRLYRERRAWPVGPGPGTQAGDPQERLGIWTMGGCNPSPLSLAEAAEEPQGGQGHVWEAAGAAPGPQSPVCLDQLPVPKHVSPCHLPGRASGPACFPFGERYSLSRLYFSRLSPRNLAAVGVMVLPLLRARAAPFPDSRAAQGVQTPPALRGHPSPRKPRLEGGAARPPPAWAAQCPGGPPARLPAAGWPQPGQ